MILNKISAQDIATKTTQILKKNINIMNSEGIIIGSGDPKRLNTYHEGASKVLQTGQTIEVYPHDVEKMVGVLPGIVLPIYFHKTMVGVVGITGDPDEIRTYCQLVKMTVEVMLEQTNLLEQVHLKEIAKETYIYDLFHNNIPSDQEKLFLDRGRELLGVDLTLPRVAIVCEFNLASIKRSILKDIQSFFSLRSNDIITPVGGDRFVILTVTEENLAPRARMDKMISNVTQLHKELECRFKLDAVLGIGEYYAKWQDLQHSFEDALQAISLGKKLHADQKIFHTSQFTLAKAVVAFSSEMKKRITHRLSDALVDMDPDQKSDAFQLIDTVLIHNLNLSEAAHTLFVHRNTVVYRIEKLKGLSGLDLRHYFEATELYLASLLLKLDA